MNRKEASEELLRRRKARKDFWAYCQYMDSSFFTESKSHLKLIASKLQAVAERKIKKLILCLPPRAGKSYTVSLWCAWQISRNPEKAIMRNSYGQSLAEKFSYDIRDIVKRRRHTNLFPVQLKQDKKQISDWSIESAKQSSYFCSGVGGGITGKGCNLAAILDDPIKNLEDALSEQVIEKTWQWYLTVHKSRIESDCPEIHIATRWSKKDPIGMLLEEEPGQWEVVNIPALIEGKSFCEQVKTTAEYLEIKTLMDSAIWETVYMQNPIESKGLLFPTVELNRFSMNELQKDPAFKLGYVDVADEGNDYLCSLIGEGYGEKVFITDIIYTQDPIEITEGLVSAQIINKEPDIVTVESNFGGKSFARRIKELIYKQVNSRVVWKANTSNKETRILIKSGLIKKNFYFRNDYPAGSDYDKFMKHFTNYVKLGKNQIDDSADAATGLAEIVFDKKRLSAALSL